MFFIPIPYYPIPIIATFDKNLDPFLIAIFGSIGTLFAKMILFYFSYCGYNILSKDAKKRLFSLQKVVKSYGWISAFIGAVSPISGNIIYVSLGLAKYNPLKFASAIFAGKIMLNLIIVLISIILGRPFIDGII